jgi:hypothetical protein
MDLENARQCPHFITTLRNIRAIELLELQSWVSSMGSIVSVRLFHRDFVSPWEIRDLFIWSKRFNQDVIGCLMDVIPSLINGHQ